MNELDHPSNYFYCDCGRKLITGEEDQCRICKDNQGCDESEPDKDLNE